MASHEQAMSLGIKDVVARLIDILGLSLVAKLTGVSETRAVQQWTNGREPQQPQLLRFALQLALIVTAAGDGTVARAWFQGSNPHLDDRSPAEMMRTMKLTEIQAPLAAAARAFAARSSNESQPNSQG